MENVEGILTSNDGKTFSSIKDDFEQMGYKVIGKKLNAAGFGQPQKRKRVIIIGIKTKKNTFPNILPYEFLQEDEYITVKDAIGNLPYKTKNSINDNIKVNKPKSNYQLLMSGLISFEEYFTSLQKE